MDDFTDLEREVILFALWQGKVLDDALNPPGSTPVGRVTELRTARDSVVRKLGGRPDVPMFGLNPPA